MRALQDRYLRPVVLAELAADALAGLATLDAALAPERGQAEWRLLLAGRTIARQSPPGPADAAAWAQLVAGFAQAAAQASQALRQAGQGSILVALMDGATSRLDPYSRYVPPAEARTAREARRGRGGIGVRTVPAGDGAAIIAVVPDSPADHAGLAEGDRILAVDGVRLRGMSEATVAAMLAGDEDTRVVLSVRSSRRGLRQLALIRALIVPPSVTWERRGAAAVFHITTFNRLTDQHLAHALLEAQSVSVPPGGIVLDLRGNRGGLLRQAVAVADLFLGDGEIAATRGRHPDAARTYIAGAGDLSAGLPLVVLVDGATASAAEIVAAALQARGRAAVVGTATMGKGLVQTVIRLPDDGELVMTWSRVIVPPGRPLQQQGVLPGLCTAHGAAAAAHDLAQLRVRARIPVVPERRPGEEELAQLMARGRAACPPRDGEAADIEAALALLADGAAMAAATGVAAGVPPAPPAAPRENLAGVR